MNYLISAPSESSWRMDPSEFMASLLARWPNAKVLRIRNSTHFSHAWMIPTSRGILEGEFNQTESGVTVHGPFQECAAFAIWFRSLVPAERPLVFYDEGYNVHVNISTDTTAADLISAFRV